MWWWVDSARHPTWEERREGQARGGGGGGSRLRGRLLRHDHALESTGGVRGRASVSRTPTCWEKTKLSIETRVKQSLLYFEVLFNSPSFPSLNAELNTA